MSHKVSLYTKLTSIVTNPAEHKAGAPAQLDPDRMRWLCGRTEKTAHAYNVEVTVVQDWIEKLRRPLPNAVRLTGCKVKADHPARLRLADYLEAVLDAFFDHSPDSPYIP